MDHYWTVKCQSNYGNEKITRCIYYKVHSNRIVRICPESVTIQNQFNLNPAQQLPTKYPLQDGNETLGRTRCCRCYLDATYLQSTEAIFKLMEICLCCLIILIGVWVHGVGGEKGFTIFVANFALLITIVILTVKLATLNRYLTPKHWFVMETAIYAALSCGFITAAAFLLFIGAHYWEFNNLIHETLPLILSVSLLCGFVYIGDAILVFRHRNARTWIPFLSDYNA